MIDQPYDADGESSIELLERHQNAEAAERVLRAAADHLYAAIPDGTRMDLDPQAKAVDILDRLRAELLSISRDDLRDEDAGRTRIGNTPTCEDCGKAIDLCDCED